MNITLRELIDDYAGGIRGGRTLKAMIPGGSSVPRLMLPDQLDTPASFNAHPESRFTARFRGPSSSSTTASAWCGSP